MAEYRINDSGELVIEDDDCDVTVTPAADFPQILALITPQVSPPAGDRVVFSIEDGDLIWRQGFDHDVIYMADDDDTGNVPDDAPKPNTYRTMADWLVQHQPAVDLATVKAWGTYCPSSGPVHAFIQSRITPQVSQADTPQPAPTSSSSGKLRINSDGGLVYDDRCIALRHANIDNIFSRVVAADLVLSAAEVADLVGMPSHRAVEWLRPRLDQVASSANPAPWYRNADGLLFHRSYGKMHVIGSVQACPDDQDAAEWALVAQPEVNADDLAYLTTAHNTSHDCAIRLREIRAAMEATKDCDLPCEDCDCASDSADVAPAPETPVQRNVVITITFDPADTECAESIYRGVNSIGYPYRRDCVRTRID